MNSSEMIELLKFVGGFAVVYISARLAINKFYREKWWEKRVDYYLKVIDSVYVIQEADLYRLRDQYTDRCGQDSDPNFSKLSKVDELELNERADKARSELKRLAHIAPLVLSEKASCLMFNYLNESEKIYPQWYRDEINSDEAYNKTHQLSQKLLSDLLQDSKNILKVK